MNRKFRFPIWQAFSGRGLFWAMASAACFFVGEPNRLVADEHPLDPAIRLAEETLAHIRQDIRDYSATLIKREQIENKLNDYEHMHIKIRNRRERDGQLVAPFSVYMKFAKPAAKNGREVIWVEGRNNGNLIAHETGFINLFRLNLDPNGSVAMAGNRHPISQIGIENITVKMLERARRDRDRTRPEVIFSDNARIGERPCLMVQVSHPERKPFLDFHLSRVYLDKELNIPIRYAAFDWPAAEDQAPPVMEEYTYVNVKVNVGLTEQDFDPDNRAYSFP